MRKWKMGAIGLLVGLMTIFSIGLPTAAQPPAPPTYRFMYATQPVSGRWPYTLHWVDPANPDVPEQTLTLGDYLHPCHETSPDGRWLILCYTDPIGGGIVYTVGLMLLDLMDNSIHSVASILVNSDYISQLDEPKWSPNSHYLVFTDYTFDGMNSYLYDAENETVTPITVPEFIDDSEAFGDRPIFRLWSADSQYIIASRCSDAQCTNTQLEVLRVADMQVVVSRAFETRGFELCSFDWSPDRRYISFMTYCLSNGLPPPFREIFIWDTQLDTFEQLTHFTNPPPDTWTEYPPERHAIYSTLWYDAQTLLLSADVNNFVIATGVDPESIITQTLRYQFPGAEAAVLSDFFVREWAVNPHTGDIAFVSQTLTTKTYEGGGTVVEIAQASVRVATLENGDLQSTISAPSGYDLRWSPDGNTLAYVQDNHPRYTYTPTDLYFLQVDTRRVRHFSLPDPDKGYTELLGWGLAPQNGQTSTPYFMDGTPTPIPMFNGAG